MADDPSNERPLRRLRTFDPAGPEWAALHPTLRAAFNRLRRQRHLPPYPEPAVDLSSRPHAPPPDPRKLLGEPSVLARRIVRDGDPSGALGRELLTAIAAMMDAYDGDASALMERLRTGEATPEEVRFAGLLDNRRRLAQRPKPLRRQLAEQAAGALLYDWDDLPPRRRPSLKAVLYLIGDHFGVSRSVALEMLANIRKHKNRRARETLSDAQPADGPGSP